MALKATWEELNTREAWVHWLAVARTGGDSVARESAEYWSTDEGCAGCRHFDAPVAWCNLVELPAARNPVLDMLGMACCGAGFESESPQFTLDLHENGIPF